MGRLCAATREGVEGFSKAVALKWILPELSNTPRFREMFLNEARTAALLDHPNIVTTYELGEWDGEYVIAMEYLPGEDLRATIRRANALGQAIPTSVAITMAIGCSRGLHFAHELTSRDGEPMSIVHRDVNPSNIMLTYHGVVKLLDFGVARAKNQTLQTKTGSFKGKLRYASPEQLSGGTVDRRGDVFSLAIVLWECLTGRQLFDATNELAIVDAVRSRKIIPPSTYRADVPEALDRIVLTALQRDPSRRYPTAAAFGEALSSIDVARDRDRALASWLRRLFGEECAALKLDVARGHLEGSVERLVAANDVATTQVPTGSSDLTSQGRLRPRTAWSTDLPTSNDLTPPPLASASPTIDLMETNAERPFVSEAELSSAQTTRRPMGLLVTVGATLLGACVAGWLLLDSPAADAVDGVASQPVAIDSTPPGAQVFVGGEPTGLRTPTSLHGLAADRATDVRLVLAGHVPVERAVRAGDAVRVILQANVGTVRVASAPPSAELFVDGRSHGAVREVVLPVGPHRLRVEASQAIVFETRIDVGPGESTVDVGEERGQ